MSVKISYAASINGVIGHEGRLPWIIKEDLTKFRTLTMHKTVIMGRKTWNSLDDEFRPLPHRKNIVITGTPTDARPGCKQYTSLVKALEEHQDEEVWVIGGASLIEDAAIVADEIRLTLIHNSISGDTRVDPRILENFVLTHSSDLKSNGELTYNFLTFKRR